MRVHSGRESDDSRLLILICRALTIWPAARKGDTRMGRKKKDESVKSELEKLSAEEIQTLLTLARALKGAPAKAVEKPKREDPDFTKVIKFCPHCETNKKVIPDFGVRTTRAGVRPQPWCRQCRNEANYHNAPRVYKKRG